MIHIDDLDKKLIAELQRNANAPLSEIAKKLGSSSMTISRRIKKLTSLGIIERFTIIVNQEKLGKPVLAFILIRVSLISKVNQIAEKISKMEGVDEIYTTWSSGAATCIVKVSCKSMEELQGFLKRISAIDGVMSVELYPISKSIKV